MARAGDGGASAEMPATRAYGPAALLSRLHEVSGGLGWTCASERDGALSDLEHEGSTYWFWISSYSNYDCLIGRL